MKVEYTSKVEIYLLDETVEGAVIRPTNSRELFLVGDKDAMHPIFADAAYAIEQELWNPQGREWVTHENLICVMRLCDGSVGFMPNNTEVEILNCKLLVEGE